MANQTPLGNLDVIISADWSDLQSEVNAAVAASQTAASAIEAAFNGIDTSEAVASIGFLGGAAQAAGESLSTFGQAAQDSTSGIGSLDNATAPLAGSLSDVGDAAVSAGGDLGGFGSDASQAAGDAHEAEGGVQGLAEQFVALGEALAVTEGLKEFGQEALTAYGTVQSVTIGLTALTKSAEDADTIIEEVKQLAATEPFAFPEIAPTIQKMVAMGVAANQIPAVMQAVADSSAATGNQFSQVANMLDRMSISGTANARSMTTLGISTTDLGNAMGVTADQATAAFKSLDSQSDRVDVLSQALSKFAGTAVAEAQGISGAWQIFQNQFEEVMVGVGEDLAPAVGAILSFGEAVLTDVKSAIDTFNLLPGPVKETAVAIGIAVAALVPLTALISGAGFAMIGLETAWSTATGILAAFGVTSGAVAVEEGALATAQGVAAVSAGTLAVAEGAAGVAMTGAGAAAAASATGFAALSAASTAALVGLVADVTAAGAAVAVFATETIPAAGAAILSFATIDVAAASAALGAFATGVIAVVGTALAPLAVAVLAAGAAFAGWELGTWANNNVPGMTALDNKITSMIQHIPLLQTLVNQLSGASVDMMSAAKQAVLIQTLQTALEAVGVTIQKGTMNANEYANALLAAAAAHGLLGTAAITAAGTQVTLANGMDAVTAKVNTQKQAVDDTRAVMVNFQAAVKNGTATQAELDLATRNYNAAVLALTPNVKAQKDTIDGVTQAMEQAQEKAQSSISVFQDLATAHSGDADAVGLLAASYTKAESAAKAAGIAFASAAGEAAKQKVSFDQAIASTQAMEGALGQLIIEYNDQLKAGQDTTAIQEQIALSLKDVQSEVTKTGGTYHNATAELIALNVAGQNAMDKLTGEAAVWQGLAGTVGKTATQMVEMNTAFAAVQKDAAAVGLAVQQVGNSLVFTVADASKATPAMQALAQQMTANFSAGVDWVDINGKLVPTMAALADASVKQANADGVLVQAGDQVRSVQAFQNQENGTGVVVLSGLTQATNAHSTALQNQAQAAAQAKQAQIDLGSTYQTVQSTIQSLTNAGKNEVTSLENMVGAFTSLNSSTQTTISGQVALQNALKGAQSAGAALGITITSTGATTTSTNAAIIALTKAINDQIAAANSGANSNQNYIGSLNGIASAAKNASDSINEISDAVSSFDHILAGSIGAGASGGQGITGGIGSLVSQTINGITTTQELMPPDPNPGHDHWVQSSLSWVPDTAPGTSTGTSGGWQSGIWNDGAAAVAANTTATTANTTATTASTTATGTSIPVMTAYTSNLQVAGNTLGNAIPTLVNLGTALGSTVTSVAALNDAAAATTPVMQALLDTGDSAANELSKLGINANQESQQYAQALADSTNAQNAYTNAVLAGTDSQAQLQQLYAAAQSADAAMLNQVGTASVQATQALTTTANTSLTAADELKGLGINASELTSAQQSYYAAVAASTNAQNAFSNALNSGTASAAQLTALLQASYAAQEAVNNATGSASVGNANQSSSSQTVNMTAQPSEPPSGLTQMQIATGAWEPDYANGTWVWNQNAQTVGGAQGSSNNFPGASAGPGEPVDYSSNIGLGLSGTNPNTGLPISGAPSITLAPVFNFGTVVGSNAAQQLVNLVMPQVVAQLRQAGVKI